MLLSSPYEELLVRPIKVVIPWKIHILITPSGYWQSPLSILGHTGDKSELRGATSNFLPQYCGYLFNMCSSLGYPRLGKCRVPTRILKSVVGLLTHTPHRLFRLFEISFSIKKYFSQVYDSLRLLGGHLHVLYSVFTDSREKRLLVFPRFAVGTSHHLTWIRQSYSPCFLLFARRTSYPCLR